MLARANRLSGTKSFEEVKEKGRLFQSKTFAIAVLARKDEKPCRFGFVVSNKISKRANIRNKIKRALREATKANLRKLKPGHDVVFLVKKAALNTRLEEVGDEVSSIFKEAGIII